MVRRKLKCLHVTELRVEKSTEKKDVPYKKRN